MTHRRFPTITSGAVALLLTLVVAAFPSWGGLAAQAPQRPQARNLILFVADGGGASHWALARRARGDSLAVASMSVAGLVDTQNWEGGITDSAAGATAYATGHRSFNRGIAMSPGCWAEPEDLADAGGAASCEPMETLLEAAEEQGRSTGLVTTTRVVDATPASFAAHNRNRYASREIAVDMIASGVDVLMGGGRRAFDEGLGEGSHLLSEQCREADCPSTASELRGLGPSDRRLFGLLADGEMPPAPEREVGLPEMTEIALDRLSGNPRGFFLLVETEGTDSYSHGNRSAAAITAEIVSLDRAVEVALEFARANPRTLVVVTSDHETGGLSVYRDGGEVAVRYTSGNHSDALVPLFAEGPGASELSGLKDNDQVGRILWRLFIGEGPPR